MFTTIKSLIPEPRQADQPRHYIGRHRQPEPIAARVAVIPGPANEADAEPAVTPPACAEEASAK